MQLLYAHPSGITQTIIGISDCLGNQGRLVYIHQNAVKKLFYYVQIFAQPN